MTANFPPPAPDQRPSSGLATASLVCGILGLLMSPILLGALPALAGLVLAMVALAKPNIRKGMAAWGLGLSLAAMLATALFAFGWYRGYKYIEKAVQDETAGRSDNKFAAWIGQPAPEIEVTSLDGQAIKLSDFKGRRVVVDFWATWCPPCRMEIPHFIDIASDDSLQDVFILGISDEDEDTLKGFARKNGINYPVASASLSGPPYDLITGIPTTFFIDRNGVIRNVIVGYHDLEGLKEEITKLDSP